MTAQASIRARQAAELLGIGEATFWRWVKERADFPKGIKLSPRVTVFQRDELIVWRDAQAGARGYEVSVHAAPGTAATVSKHGRTVEIAVASATGKEGAQ